MADPTWREVELIRKRIDKVNRQLKPHGKSCLKKEKEYKMCLEAYNEKSNEKATLVNRLMEFKMEMAQTDNGNTPKSYSLNMFKDFVPMCVFSESNQEKLACEGKVEHKFDMEPHRENLVDYGKLCRERTKNSMVKTRKVQVLENDHGMGMRPMPGMVGLVPSGPKVNMIGTHFEENHVATGFGNHLAIPILHAEWREDMTFEEAVKLVEKCLLVLLYRDRSSINKFQIAKITTEGVTIYPPYSLKTHWGFSAFENPSQGAVGSW